MSYKPFSPAFNSLNSADKEKNALKEDWKNKFLLVIMFWPDVSRGQDVEGKDVGVYDGLISLGRVSNTTCGQINDNETGHFFDF